MASVEYAGQSSVTSIREKRHIYLMLLTREEQSLLYEYLEDTDCNITEYLTNLVVRDLKHVKEHVYAEHVRQLLSCSNCPVALDCIEQGEGDCIG